MRHFHWSFGKIAKGCQEKNLFLCERNAVVEEIKQKCGQVCDTDLGSDIDGKYYNQLWKNIDCKAMFKHSIFDRLSMFSRPIAKKDLPKSVKDEFTYQGKLQMKPLYADNSKCNV